MGKILCFVYPEMADFEITLLLHRLRKLGRKEILSVAVKKEPLMSQAGLVYLPQLTMDEALAMDKADVEALILPGGPIQEQPPGLTELIQQLDREQKLLAAICFAPQFLGRAGILDRHQFTTSCSEQHIRDLGVPDPYPRHRFVKKRVVVDGHVITAEGRAFVDFAYEVCDWLGIFESPEQKQQMLRDNKGDT